MRFSILLCFVLAGFAAQAQRFSWGLKQELVPFRNSNFYDDLEALEYLGADPVKSLPVAFSFGFHFKMNKQ